MYFTFDISFLDIITDDFQIDRYIVQWWIYAIFVNNISS